MCVSNTTGTIYPVERVLAEETDRLCVLSFVIDGVQPKDIEQALDRKGIAVRSGDMDARPLLEALSARRLTPWPTRWRSWRWCEACPSASVVHPTPDLFPHPPADGCCTSLPSREAWQAGGDG